MCGINGFNFVDKKLIKSMNDSIKHRGPDAEGTFIDKKVSLGHRRLSILDLSVRGKQPMEYTAGKSKVIIVFNGEIYNFQEIRNELILRGHSFNSNTDTEVILASYLEWGEDCVNKFNGMWAFCIYDSTKKILFISRDRIGKKPLHYFFDGNKFIFSSEIKSILEHSIIKELDKESTDLYFSLGFIPAPKTIYREIKKLEAGHNLIFDLKTKKLEKKKYYLPPTYNPTKNKRKLIEEGKELLLNSTKLRMIADVPLGAFLSGGLDSSTIVAEMIKNTKKENLNTFSIGFEGKFDETEFVDLVKDNFKTKHHHRYFKERDFEDTLKKAFFYFDEPFSDPSMFPTIFLSEFAREKLTVSLSGDGGDEVFGGYPRYKIAAKLVALKKMPKFFRKMALIILPESKLKQGIKTSLLPLEEIYSSSREDIYKPKVYKDFMRASFSYCLKLAKGDLVEAFILMDRYFLTLSDNYLTKVDRASMAHALEVRSPLLDYRFFEYAARIPSKWKTNIFKTKILMRDLVNDEIPKKIVNRKKAGFTPPIEDWILQEKYSIKLRSILEKLCSNGLLDSNWKEFYLNRILNKEDVLSKNYRIRLLLFYEWVKFWKFL